MENESAEQERCYISMKDLSDLKLHNDTLLAEVIAALKQNLGDALVSVILFGSRARGEAHEGSDWDLLVIARDLPPKLFKRHIQLKQSLPVAWRGEVTVLAKTPQEFEAHLPSLLLDIALDGIILYDTDNYAGEKMADLRRFIQRQGLHRERIERDWFWRWDCFPGFDWSLNWEEVQRGGQ